MHKPLSLKWVYISGLEFNTKSCNLLCTMKTQWTPKNSMFEYFCALRISECVRNKIFTKDSIS